MPLLVRWQVSLSWAALVWIQVGGSAQAEDDPGEPQAAGWVEVWSTCGRLKVLAFYSCSSHSNHQKSSSFKAFACLPLANFPLAKSNHIAMSGVNERRTYTPLPAKGHDIKKNEHQSPSNSSQNLSLEHFQTHSMKPTLFWYQSQIKALQEVLSTNILDECGCRNRWKKNTSKQNSTAHWKDYMPWPSGIYSWNARMAQHMKINQGKIPH